ncbi:MAG TPA: class I SAM-dependent methyltransferase [Rhizomicrobium sp.]|nr:class I SAM-dependent methyltransferase [Rhizomicrobium sp.]
MNKRANYGIDAPGVVRTLAMIGLAAAATAAIGFAWPNVLPASLRNSAACTAAALLFTAAAMLWSSLVGKKRVRDRLVAALALSGSERVLDAGCGRGLALIGCAKKLTTGRAVGIDLWAAKDLSNNNPEAARANATAEGVADRIEIQTGDITKLPFPDASFDAVITMTVIHNIPSRDGRDQAVRELVRVLKPGGRLALFDILHTSRYARILRQSGLNVRTLGYMFLWLAPSRSLFAEKPGNS